MRRAVALTLLLFASGCIVNAPDGPGDIEPARMRLAYFTPDLHLVEGAAPEGAVRTGAFFQKWAAGTDYPTWSSEGMGEDVIIDAINVTLRLRATGPVIETSRFPDIMVYGAGGEAWTAFGSVTDQSAFIPGNVYEFTIAVVPPTGGLWVPATESFGIKVVPVMLQQDAGANIEILTGPSGSRVEWTQRPLSESPRPFTIEHAAGEAIGSAYAGAAAPESTSHRIPITIAENTRALVAWMNVTANEGIPDVDFSLEGPDGTVIAFSGTPTPREHLKLHAAQLATPGEYALIVTSYGSARARFTVDYALS